MMSLQNHSDFQLLSESTFSLKLFLLSHEFIGRQWLLYDLRDGKGKIKAIWIIVDI